MVFHLAQGEGVKGVFSKECPVAYVPFSIRIVNKIWQGCLNGCGGCCCKNDCKTQFHIKGALMCKILADWWSFFLSWAKA